MITEFPNFTLQGRPLNMKRKISMKYGRDYSKKALRYELITIKETNISRFSHRTYALHHCHKA